MKVSKVSSPSNKTHKVKKKEASPGSSFTNLMQDKKDNETKEKLDKMMKDIKDKGEQLVDSRDIELLIHYKKKVKEFVSTAVEYAFEIVDRKGMSRMGRSKILKVVSMVDENLASITDDFLSEERNKLNLLSKIGELGGLLTNIYV